MVTPRELIRAAIRARGPLYHTSLTFTIRSAARPWTLWEYGLSNRMEAKKGYKLLIIWAISCNFIQKPEKTSIN